MTAKTGAEHLASLRDGRVIHYRGQVVTDVTTHPAFRQAAQTAAGLYDFQAAPEHAALMTFPCPETSRLISRAWEQPRDMAGLVARRHALEAQAERTCGFLGRSPDHVASCLSGMVMNLPLFEAYNPKRARALDEYFRHVRRNDLWLSYVIINPQADRSKAASAQAEDLVLGVVDEDAGGITVRGAKMLATGGILANEVFVTCIQPLQPGDERFALSFAIPMNAPGLKILSRRSYEEAAEGRFVNPLASNLDENDAVLWFEDVKVPWERVFIDRDTAMCLKQFHETPAHVWQNYQAMIRLSVKLRFLAGIGRRIAETNGLIGIPVIRERLGELAAQAAMVEGLVAGMEAKAQPWNGFLIPDRHTLYAAQTLTQTLYGTIIASLRELAGGGLIMLPSGPEDFAVPEMRGLIEKTQRSPAVDAEQRVRFFNLAWDAIGSEFASRHSQYELFYAGAPMVPRNHSFRTYDWAKAAGLVDHALAAFSEPAPTSSARAHSEAARSRPTRSQPARSETTRQPQDTHPPRVAAQ